MQEKVVLRLVNSEIIKGYIKDFSECSDETEVEDPATGKVLSVKMESLKAIFFVKSFDGDPAYRESKRYGRMPEKKKRVYVRFKDRESLLGYIEGDIPWKKGFFLSKTSDGKKGFFLIPTDGESNNKRVFVVASSIEDIAFI